MQKTGPCLYYFPDGQLREKRTDLKNENGKATRYYPNGNIESIINYLNGKIDIPNNVFYDFFGENKKALEVESLNYKNKLTKEEIASGKFNDKVVVFYKQNRHRFYGYAHYNSNGEVANVFNYRYKEYSSKADYNSKINNMLVKVNYKDFVVGYNNDNIMFIYDNDNNIKYYCFNDKDNYTNLYKYGGKHNILENIKIINNNK